MAKMWKCYGGAMCIGVPYTVAYRFEWTQSFEAQKKSIWKGNKYIFLQLNKQMVDVDKFLKTCEL